MGAREIQILPGNVNGSPEYEPANNKRAFQRNSQNKMPGSIRTMEVGARPDGRLLNGPLWDKA